MADYLAVGIDPDRTTIFAHSQVPELNQLMLPFLSLVSVPELARNPTVKEERAASGLPAASGLLFTYPVHQAADILFCHGNVVPVGKDQLPAPRDDPRDRQTLQPALQPARAVLPANPTRCSATRRSCSAPTARR